MAAADTLINDEAQDTENQDTENQDTQTPDTESDADENSTPETIIPEDIIQNAGAGEHTDLETLTELWQTGAAHYLDRPHTPHLRISSASKCARSLAYAMLGVTETEPPDEDAEYRMALGHMAEILIIRGLHRRGWETRHTVLEPGGQLELELEIPGTDRVITGHPDGICRHPELTNNMWITLECKSMGPERAQETEAEGVAKVYPGYMVQIALYSHHLHQQGIVSHPNYGLFAMMDREGRFVPPERVKWDADIYGNTMEKLKAMIESTDMDSQLPERPYAPSSYECKLCNYHTACHGQYPLRESREGGAPKPINLNGTPEIVEAARIWADLKPKVDQARDVLQEACHSHNKQDIEANEIVAGYFVPRGQGPVYDSTALRKYVPADMLRRCLMKEQPEPRYGFWVRNKKRK